MTTTTAAQTITRTTWIHETNGSSVEYANMNDTNLEVKGPDSSSQEGEKVALLMLDIPTKETLGIPDNSQIETISITLHKESGGTRNVQLWMLNTSFVEETASWFSEKNHGAATTTVTWDPTINAPTNSILKRFCVEEANSGSDGNKVFTIPQSVIDEESIDFGTTHPFGLYMTAQTNTATVYKDDSQGSEYPTFTINYGQTKPNAPKITISGAEDTSVTITNESTYEDTNSLAYLIWRKTNSTIAASGTRQATFTDTNWKTMNSADLAQISSEDFLQDEDTKYYIRAFHENLNNQTTEAVGGNVVEAIRPKVNSVTVNTAWTNTGDVGQLTVASASSNHSGFFKKLYIIWDGASSGETYNSSNITTITLDEVANSVAKTHIYSSTGTKYIWVGIEDANGLKSDLNLISDKSASQPNPNSSAATCVAALSKKTMPVSQFGLLDDVNAVNMIRSTTGDSSLEIAHYSVQHSKAYSDVILTSFATECNNSSLESGSKQLQIWQNNNTTSSDITVFGIASFYDNNGTETAVADTAAEFDTENGYYKYVSDTIDCGNEFDFSGPSTYFFKQVDMALITAISGESDSDPTRFAVCSTSFTWGVDEPILHRLCCTKNSKGWSNYFQFNTLGANDIQVDKTNNTYTFVGVGGNWYFNRTGFFIGDKVYLKHNETPSLDGYYTITGITGGTGSRPLKTGNSFTVSPPLAGSGTNDEQVTIMMDTRANAAIPFAAYGSTSSGSADLTCNVSQTAADAPATASNVTVNYHVPELITLNELIAQGHIALLNSNYGRAGGLDGKVPLGKQIYPIGIIRTNSGMPVLNISLKILTQTGLRAIWNIIEGNRYDYCILGSDRIDSPTSNHRDFVLKMMNGNIEKSTDDASFYNATLSFMIIGEQRVPA